MCRRQTFCFILILMIVSAIWATLSNVGLASSPSVSEKDIIPDGIDTDLLWLVDSELTADVFPVAFYSRSDPYNLSVQTSWGFFLNKSNGPLWAEPRIVWVELPQNSSEGLGNVTVGINDLLYETYSVSWKRKAVPQTLPSQITLKYYWFYYWGGETVSYLTFWPNASVHIRYSILRIGYANDVSLLPYESEFSFTTSISSDFWRWIQDYLVHNASINWQSWVCPPVDYMGTISGAEEPYGHKIDVTISWNDSSTTTYSEKLDASGTWQYLVPLGSTFNALLLEKGADLITQYFESSSSSSFSVSTPSLSSSSFPASVSSLSVFVSSFPSSFQFHGFFFAFALLFIYFHRRKKVKN